MASLYNLAIGYLVSFVFYLVVVRYKEYRDEIYVNSVTLPFVERIIESSALVNQCITKDESSFPNEEILKSHLVNIKYNEPIPKIAATFLYPETTWDSFLVQEKVRSQKNIQRLFSFIAHIEPELIKIVTDLDSCSYYIFLVFVNRYTEDMRSKKLEEISDSLYKHNVIVKKLQDYVDCRKAP